jgi:hypothetical protein
MDTDRDRHRDWDMDTDKDRDDERDETGTRTGTGIQKGTGTFPRGIRPRGATFEFGYLGEFETEFENYLGCDSGVHMGLIHKKTEAENLVLLSLLHGK